MSEYTPTTSNTGLIAATQELGVHDLPLGVRRWFAKALLAERSGNTDEAEGFLAQAVEAEAAVK